MSTNKNKIIIGVAAVAIIGAIAVWKWPRGKTETPETSGKLSAFIDWNLTPAGPLADEARTLMTERLIDIGQEGRIIYRLAGAIEVSESGKEGIAKIKIKDGIYWSDQVQLTAQHVVDAWNRYKEAARQDVALREADGTTQWLRGISLKATDKLQMELSGFTSKEDMTNMIRSRYLIPIRLDLINAENGVETAWLTTIGRYRLQKLPPEVVAASAELEFVPNASYYRGAARETVRVAVGKMAAQATIPKATTEGGKK